MITPRMSTSRIKPSAFLRRQPSADLFVEEHRQNKLGAYVANLAAMDELIDFCAVAAAVDAACPRADRSKGGRPPYSTGIMVRMVFLQSRYNLPDEAGEHQVLDRMSFQHVCRLDGVPHIPDARTLWRVKQRLVQGSLGGRALFDAVSQQLRQQGYIPRGGQFVDDGQTLQAVLDPANTRGRLLADRGYDSHANRELLARHRLREGIARRAKPGQEARQRLDARERTIDKTRARVEHGFAGLEQLGGKLVRAMTLARNELAITLKGVAYNAKRLVWLVAQGAPT